MPAGIETRHRKACAKPRPDGRCCDASFRAWVFNAETGKKIHRTFPTASAAKRWRQDSVVALRHGKLAEAKPRLTLREACEKWATDAEAGVITTRSGDRYKPGALRSYRQSLRLRVLDELGDHQFYAIKRRHLQELVDRLVAEGHAPPTVQGAVTALRVVYRRALQLGDIEHLPTQGLKLPAIRSRRDRVATPQEAVHLLAVLDVKDRAIWATAMYAGLRRGELMALRWDDVDLQAGTITVRRAWDIEHGPQETKNRTTRRVPIPAALREHLAAHRLQQEPGAHLAFGAGAYRPFSPSALTKRADRAWAAAGLERLMLHEGRHTYASLMIAAGVNAKALCDYMGHSSIKVTYDKYGHLMPGNEAQAAGMLDAFLQDARADGS